MVHHTSRLKLAGLILLVISLVVSACGTPQPAPAPEPTAVAQESTPAAQIPAQATVQPPAASTPEPAQAPTPTVEPLDLPPVAVETSPQRGAEQPLDAPILIRFDQAMDPASTGQAFAIQPDVTGDVAVQGEDLVFTPGEPLARGQAYEVTVDQQATGQNGKMLAAPVQLRFNAVGFLEVTSTQPAGGNDQVSADSPITVIFNRPVVPLTGISQSQDLPQPLSFEPAVPGKGEWLNTSIYRYVPDEALAGATEYTVTVNAGLEDTTGGLLAEDFVFSFTTANPVVNSLEPMGDRVAPSTAVTVTFSQPMQQATTEAAFSLRSGETDDLVAGSFTWSDGDRTLRFQPDEPLFYDLGYVAQVTTGARSANGNGALREPYVNRFTTAPSIRIVRTEPADGATGVAVEGNMQVVLAGIVDLKTLGNDALTIIPAPTEVISYYSDYDGRWVINWPFQPQTDYQVTLAGGIGDIFGNTIGRDTVVRFSTGDRKPFAHLNVPNDVGTYNAYVDTQIAVSYRNVSRLDLKLYTVGEADAQRLLGPNRWDAFRTYQPREDRVVRAWSVVVTPEENQNTLSKIPLAEDGGPLPSGLYWVEMRAPEVTYATEPGTTGQEVPRHLLIVSPLNLIYKNTATEVLIWATDLRSGQPVGDLPVRVTGAATAQGSTAADGIFRAPIDPREPWQSILVFTGPTEPASAPGGAPQPFGVVSSDWSQGISAWDFGINLEYPPPTWQGYFYTDRPLYRPGQMVYWKGILRADNDAVYALPPAGYQLQVTIRDGQGNEIYNQVHETNAFGTIHGELQLDPEAGLGYYYLEARPVQVDESANYIPGFGLGFQVAEYRKPEFEITLDTDKAEYLQGDTIEATLQATFFFGGPVSNADVEWNVYSENAYFDFSGDTQGRWYSFSDYTGWDPRQLEFSGGSIGSGSGATDGQGQFAFQIPAEIGDKSQSQQFRISVRILDVSNQEVFKDASVVVHKGLVYPGVAVDSSVVQVGQESQVQVITVDWDSQPVPDQEVTIEVNKAKWNTVQEKGEDGQFYWVTQVEETPVLSDQVTTDSNGKAVFTWTPEEGGQYKINALVTDSQGNTVRSATFLWVSQQGEGYVGWRVDNNDRIDLVADKPLYQVGDVAQVLVPHPYQGDVEALVTIERGTIIQVRRVTLTSNSETLEIPIEADYVPTVYVSVAIVQGSQGGSDLGSYKLGYVQLPVDTVTKQLKVTLTPNQSRLKPGDTVTFQVKVTDYEGNPVEGEFSLALVDKALLSLAQGQESTLLDTFYRQRGLGVQNASTLVVSLDRLNEQLQEGAKGGGGGGGEAGLYVDVRSDFQDVALWEPTLVTDVDGMAEVSVKLPDNLTTWRLDGRGVTVDTKVGQATVEVVTSLPLLVRPVLPRFFVTGDQAEIGAVVNNNTDVDRTVRIDMWAKGLNPAEGEPQEVVVAAGSQVKVTWPVEITPPAPEEATGQLQVRFTATEVNPPDGTDPLGDAVEMTLPVYRYSSPETVGTAGTVALDEEKLEVIVLPPNVDPTQGALTVRLEPSLAAGTIESLGWLEHFPYECNEQIVSKFLPNVFTYRALSDLGLDDPDLEANLREQIATAVQKLLQRQNADGGWGWWGGEESRVFVSSYVVYGLVEAQQAGFTVDQAAIDRGVDYLSRQLKAVDTLETWQLNQQAFVLYVLAEAGQGDTGRTVALFDVRERLGNYGRAYLALAFGVLGEQGESTAQPRVDTLVDDLNGTAIVSATGAHWEEATRDVWTMNTDTRSTAVALDVLARLDPENALAPNVVRWLMVARQADIWSTTQENVWAIIALTDWMVATGELEGDYSYRVTLNGSELDSGSVDPSNVDEPVELRVEVRDMLLDAANGLAISRFAQGAQSGQGQLYYTAHLNYYLPAADLQALDRGVVLARQYTLLDPATGKPLDDTPVTSVAVGDTIQVKLTIVAPHDLYYLVVESPLPAGTEAIDASLATSNPVLEGPQLEVTGQPDNPWWWWTPGHSELRDEKVVLFATELPAGTYEYTYQIRASLPGQFQTLPATGYEMYFPEVWGRSAGELFTVTAE